MPLSGLPTGTVSDERSGVETRPRYRTEAVVSREPTDTAVRSRTHEPTTAPAGPTSTEGTVSIEQLRRERDRLRREVDALQAELAEAEREKQNIRDRYERLLAEARSDPPDSTDETAATRADRPPSRRLLDRLRTAVRRVCGTA